MKLCALKLKTLFIYLPFLLLGFLLVGHIANATIYLGNETVKNDNSDGTYAGNIWDLQFEVPSGCSNPLLIVHALSYYTRNIISITYDGVSMTQSFKTDFGAQLQDIYAYYLVAPSTATNTLRITYDGDPSRYANISVFCGVDQTNPFDVGIHFATSGSGPSFNSGVIADYTNENEVIVSALYSADTPLELTKPATQTYVDTDNTYYNNSLVKVAYETVNNPPTSFTWTRESGGGMASLAYGVLNPSQPNINIYTFGYPYLWSFDDSIFDRNETKQFIVNWNACDEYGILNKATIYAVVNDDQTDSGSAVIYDKSTYTGPQACKGLITYFTDNYLINNNDESGEVYFILTTWDENDELISSKKSNTINFTTDLTGTYINSLMNNPLMIDLGSLPMGPQTATTTTIFFSYDFTDENAASTTVVLWDYTRATSTGYTVSGSFVDSGVGWSGVVIPTPATSTYKTYRLIAVRPGFPNLQSELIHIDWSFHGDLYDTSCQPPSYDFSHICDELNTGEGWEYLLGNTMCGLKYGVMVGFTALFTPGCESLNYFTDNYEKFKLSFPFNTFYEFIGTINTAIDTSQATTTGETFDVPFIRQTATGTEYYTIPLVSSSTFITLVGQNNYNNIRNTEEYIYWILAALAVYFIIMKKKI